ncbi:MAG: HD-GYP domain-containing protein [Spirochaetaceae bacterium]|jgi:putative two-component system response regulator|nr:HD-GYP domain-containing protein [Spirochaetaceae bacterium]
MKANQAESVGLDIPEEIKCVRETPVLRPPKAVASALRAREPVTLHKSVPNFCTENVPKEGECRPEKDQKPEESQNKELPTNFFHTSIFPLLVIDNNLKIVYANPASREFFTGFLTLQSIYFFDLFAKYFTIADVKTIRNALLKGENGYSWRGVAQIKSRDRPMISTRVYIFPAVHHTKTIPKGFIVMFDDFTEEKRATLRGLFNSLLEASKLKDNDTGQHITRVNSYSEALARELFNRQEYSSVDAEFIDNIAFLAAMHDVGKIGTPDDILNKEGPLSEFEWSIMKEHTKNGAFILEAYPNPMAKEIALSHHEKWNGKGYPFQMEGEMIPLAARIVSIADVYDALRMKRSYKPCFTHEKTMQTMRDSRGIQFDPHLFDIMDSISEKFDYIYETYEDTV